LFKILLLIACFLLLAFPVQAAIYLVEPLDQKVSANDELFFGKVARGETVQVVIKKKSDMANEWLSLKVEKQLLPPGWKVESVQSDKTLIARVTIPKDAQISTQRIGFAAGNPDAQMFNETFYATVSVNENLLNASIESLNQDAILGETGAFSLLLNNGSIAEHSVSLKSSLPSYWFSSLEIKLKPHETKTVELPVTPQSYGEKNFSFTVSSKLNSKQFVFPAKMKVKPTIVGMYQSPLAGFPFFSPGLLPYYLINGFLSIFR